MGSTYRFLALDGDLSFVYDWFARLPDAPQVISAANCQILYFPYFGDIAYADDGLIDSQRSPVASLFPPERRRNVLWTAGELHFLPTPFSELYPGLHAISRRFSKWLTRFDRVFKPGIAGESGEWNYYLEGNLRNRSTPIFALPAAMMALRDSQYFVGVDDNDAVLDKVCKFLKLRGVNDLTDR